MSFTLLDETEQKPTKRTGVWSVETTKQKLSADCIQKKFSRKGTAEISLAGEDEEWPIQNLSNFRTLDHFLSDRINWNSIKFPALNVLNDTNIFSLFNEFNDPYYVEEEDVTWTKELLFADITNRLGEDPVPAKSNIL